MSGFAKGGFQTILADELPVRRLRQVTDETIRQEGATCERWKEKSLL